jgi:hypothetical protein
MVLKIVLAAMAHTLTAAATPEDSATVHRVEVEAVPGLILKTNDFLRGNNGEVRTMNHAFTAKVKYAFAPPSGSMEARLYKGVYQGVGLAYHDLNPQLGHPVSLFLFQGATIKTIVNRLSFDYEWNLGLAYGWKNYDAQSHPDNRVIGSKMTAHINVDLYLRYRLSNEWDLNLGASITHYSNGNTSFPNAGLNIAGIKASAAYYFNRRQASGDSRQEDHSLFTDQSSLPKWVWDLTLYGAWKRKGIETEAGTYAIPGKFGVGGFNLNPLYCINRWLNVGPSFDAFYDSSANLQIDIHKDREPTEEDVHMAPWHKRVALGFSGRVEFVMPYFTINFGIGHNVVNAKTEDLKGFYEILALKIHILRKSYIHIGYSLYDFYYPNNLMLGLGLHL